MQKSIVVVGSLNLDLVARVNHLPARGETIFGRDFKTYCGGKGANQAVALARLGAHVSMIGKLGSDAFAEQLRNGLEESGVDSTGVTSTGGSSGTALITTSAEGDNTIVVIPGANDALLPEDIDRHRDKIEAASMVLAQLEIPRATTEHLALVVRAAGVPFLLDPAPAYALSSRVLESVSWLTPNESETKTLLGLDPAAESPYEPHTCAERLIALGARNVILKLGARGVYMFGRDIDGAYIDGFPVNAVDSTAAGDAFNGAFAFAVAQCGMSPKEAAEFACGAAALSVTRPGAQASMATMEECESFLDLRRASR